MLVRGDGMLFNELDWGAARVSHWAIEFYTLDSPYF